MSGSTLHIETIGQGHDVVLLHGWGVNSAVFEPIKHALNDYTVHYVDLPGFGHSDPIEGDIHDWVNALAQRLPDNAIWLGWSLGGLVATQLAINFPQKAKGLITVASSPCFMAQPNEQPQPWPGIAPQVLSQFSEQLNNNLPKTIERFLAIQAMGSESAKSDIQVIKSLVLAKPLPEQQSLQQGLDMLANIDLRHQLAEIELPWLRIWGRLDGLVPKRTLKMLNADQKTTDIILQKASHAPFISHSSLFIEQIKPWLNKIVG
ncbi:pimeloyl-ACP methyl ester esterase BioH [Shewanella gaetbuli]|uniref:Pimeloyl-[acyl-carrier protein] methyl ester esterase n=1 Tax=Shewanella gaetbuli TaxID=220752 RepID=A0A9X2CLK9_9GAMM|nr:pimeloyl-ACP methyl ester esterase BioH [Shewanella gaetbuli]MCL1142849.1 pimeloyl-ACP methyl ester esterase BioH [Shewanella gaetbuli]